MKMLRAWLIPMLAILLLANAAEARKPKDENKRSEDQKSLERYIRQYTGMQAATPTTTLGSLWSADAAFLDSVSDYKARKVGDPVRIQIVESTTSSQSGSLDGKRSYTGTSAITGLAGQTATSNLNPIISADSSSQLKGSGQTASTTALNTTLAGQVAAALPNGMLVVEARRNVLINNERQTVVVRGMVRPADIGSGNLVSSTSLANLEIEVKGKGVISDNTRPLHPVLRWIMKLVSF